MVKNQNVHRIDDFDTTKLKNLGEVVIDPNQTVSERIKVFLQQIGDPYLFKVSGTVVKVRFKANAPTLQTILETMMLK